MSDSENTNIDSNAGARTPGQPATSTTNLPTQTRGWEAVVAHVTSHKIDFILAVTRAITVFCTLSYLVGFPGPSGNRYKQALLMNAATSSLRLHQRMPPPPLNQLNRNYFMNLIREDSFHYLIFPLMFFTGQPITLALLPCALYALFNLAVYAISILDKLGNQESLRVELSNLVAKYQQNLLYTIALSEFTLMPTVLIGVFTRVVGILVPILYYRFLLLRYNSTRNAHLKSLVIQLRTLAMTYYTRYRQRAA